MDRLTSKRQNSDRRKHRVRTTISDSARPRLSVNISNRHVFAQLIDDGSGTSIVGVSSVNLKAKGNLMEKAALVGAEIAKRAKAKKIKQVAFDRGDKQYHGRVKALADEARKNGLEF